MKHFQKAAKTGHNDSAKLLDAEQHIIVIGIIKEAFGDDAMPREFYKIPGSHHLPIWTNHKFDVYGIANALQQNDTSAFDTITSIYTQTAVLPDKPLKACAGPDFSVEANDNGFAVKSPVLLLRALSLTWMEILL